MRKLLTMLIIAFLLVGCASSNDAEKTAGKKADSNIKDEAKDKESKDEKGKTDNEKKNIADLDDEKDETSNKQDKQSSGSSNAAKPSQPSDATKPTTPVETQPPVEEIPAPPTNQQAKADQVFAQINAYRQQNGKEPFITSDFLRTRSEEHALAMAEAEALWYSGNAAECITNYDDPFSAWINSPAHNKILILTILKLQLESIIITVTITLCFKLEYSSYTIVNGRFFCIKKTTCYASGSKKLKL